MRHPLATPAALLLNESLLITRPASRLRSGWLGLSVALHLLAGTALFVAPLLQTEKLEPPSNSPRGDLVRFLPPSGGGGGGFIKPNPPGIQGVEPPHENKIRPLKPPETRVIPPATPPGNDSQNNPDRTPGVDRKGGPGGGPEIGEGPGPGGPGAGPGPGGPGPGGGGPPGVQEIFHQYDLTESPKLVSREDPVYPESARQQGVEGNVDLKIVVDESGRVVDVILVRSDNPLLNASAMAAVRRWKYSAGRMDGRAVRTFQPVRIHFTLH